MKWPFRKQKTYLTQYRKPDASKLISAVMWCGPRLQATSWKEAEFYAAKWSKLLNVVLQVTGVLVSEIDQEIRQETIY
jgi:hypothetical protein